MADETSATPEVPATGASPEPEALRDAIAKALASEAWGATATWAPHGGGQHRPGHSYHGGCGICRGDIDAITTVATAAAFIRPELDRLLTKKAIGRAYVEARDHARREAARADKAEAKLTQERERLREALAMVGARAIQDSDDAARTVVINLRGILDQPKKDGEFSEQDEPIEEIKAAFDRGQKGVTAPPVRGWNETLRLDQPAQED